MANTPEYSRLTPPTVADVMKSLSVIGMGTPSIARERSKIVFQQDFTINKVGVILIDVIRCTSTLLACFGAGVRSITITVKGEADKGTTLEESQSISKLQGIDLVIGGELKGGPIPGGIIGNSPSEAANCKLLNNKHLHFESSNFGKTFSEITKITSDFKSIGGDVSLFIASFSNTEAIANKLLKERYNKIFLMCGGFYNGITLEDEIAAGKIIQLLNFNDDELDDEARTMVLLSEKFKSFEDLLDVLSSNSVSKLLAKFGKDQDIRTVIDGHLISNEIWSKMCTITPQVIWINNIPVIVNEP